MISIYSVYMYSMFVSCPADRVCASALDILQHGKIKTLKLIFIFGKWTHWQGAKSVDSSGWCWCGLKDSRIITALCANIPRHATQLRSSLMNALPQMSQLSPVNVREAQQACVRFDAQPWGP